MAITPVRAHAYLYHLIHYQEDQLMFKAIGAINRCITAFVAGFTEVITINVDSLKVISQTGNVYAKQFEQDANYQLEQRKIQLIEATL
jgi:hypothetical protein